MVKAFGADLVHVRLDWGETPEPEDLRSALAEAGDVRVVYLTHSETSTGVVCRRAGARGCREGRGRARRRRCGLEPRRRPARARRVGARRRRVRLAEGADVPARPRVRLGVAGRARGGRALDDAALRPRLGAHAQGAGEARRAVHACRLTRPRARGRARAAARRGARRGVRTSRRGSVAPAAKGRRRWASSCSRPTRSAPPSSRRSARRTASTRTEVVSALRDRFGITIANGQGELKGKIFRIGHIGWFDIFDITTALAAVELALADAGADIERGVAVTRALDAWAERSRV